MANSLADGAQVEVQGRSATYTLKRTGGVYACSCPAWRNQGATIDKRSCKHLRAYLGDAEESARVGAPAAPGTAHAAKPKVATGTGRTPAITKDTAPPVLLAHKWETTDDPTGWLMSEKLDGIRAYWDGESFVSRLGNAFVAPEWFTADMPADTLDGELWVGRKKFSRTVSIVKSGAANREWREVTYVVFDAPNAAGGFEQRLAHAKKVLTRSQSPHARTLEHEVCTGIDHLRRELARVEALGGEGLMLRKPDSAYEVGRSRTLLKVKTFHDAEARVVGHAPGAGKHSHRLGALIAQLADGTRFNVGTGLTDAEREAPPAIGTLITVRYQELSEDGVPRFPSYVGERIDAVLPAMPVSEPTPAVAPAPAAPARKKKR